MTMQDETANSSFLCVRHGLTDWNEQGRFLGRSDIPLNKTGVTQAKAAAQILGSSPPDHIVSSPLIRAANTAEIIAAALGRPLHVVPDLIECDFGSFEGRSIREVMTEYHISSKESLAGILPPDGESWATVSERSLNCVQTWLKRYPRANILFVAHDAVLQSLSERLCGKWFDGLHGQPYRFAQTAGLWNVSRL